MHSPPIGSGAPAGTGVTVNGLAIGPPLKQSTPIGYHPIHKGSMLSKLRPWRLRARIALAPVPAVAGQQLVCLGRSAGTGGIFRDGRSAMFPGFLDGGEHA